MKKIVAVMLLLVTGCACTSKEKKRNEAVRKALAETRVRYDYAVDQNERYSKQVKKLVDENRRLRKK